jgi:uncharacterized protein
MLLDTSGLLCYHHIDEPYHQEAEKLFDESGPKFCHNYILAEFVALAHIRKLPRQPALAFLRDLVQHPLVEILWVDEALHGEGMELLERRLDKGYSLCDAVSFMLMRKRGIADALTTDRHFHQEGFNRLLGI